MRSILKPKNKKGFAGILFFIIGLFLVLILGFLGSIIAGLFNYTGDIITPELQSIGVVGDVNISDAVQDTFVPLNTFVQAMTWMVGLAYVVMIIFSIIFVITYETNPHPAFMGAYIFLVFLIIFGAIIISNVYENIYTGTDDLATRLQEQTTLSYMILYSPGLLALIAIVTGIFIFSRPNVGGPI